MPSEEVRDETGGSLDGLSNSMDGLSSSPTAGKLASKSLTFSSFRNAARDTAAQAEAKFRKKRFLSQSDRNKLEEINSKFEKLYRVAERQFGLSDVPDEARGKKSFKTTEGIIRQSSHTELDALMEAAKGWKDDFERTVMQRLAQVHSPPLEAKVNLKGRFRAEQKVKLDYGGDATQLKDLLRCCVVCDDVEQLKCVLNEIEVMVSDGTIKRWVQLKNRFHEGQEAPHGYRDANTVVDFNGHLCEIQCQARPFYKFNHDHHVVYEVVRSMSAVTSSWEKAAALGVENVGVALFKKIFEIEPGALALFSFRDTPDLYNSPSLKKHGVAVVGAVGVAVVGLKDLDKLVPVLQQLGARHVGYGVVPEHFDIVGKALILTLREALGEDVFSEEVEEAWTNVFGVIKSVMTGMPIDELDHHDAELDTISE